MKPISKIISLLLILFPGIIMAQNELDALRYSQTYWYGTSRSMAMGGAFGALGGDLTAVAINPAGLGVYRAGEVGLSTGLGFADTKGKYNLGGSELTDNEYLFKLNNIGVALTVMDEDDETEWKGGAFAITYNKLNNFGRNMVAEGVNNSSSMLDHFMYNSDGYSPDYMYDSYAHMREALAYDRWLTSDVVQNDGYILYNNPIWLDGSYGQSQRKTIDQIGSIGEFTFAFATNYAHKVYLGASFGVQSVFFDERSTYSEFDENDSIFDFSSFNMQEHLKTNGVGVNFKFGAIFRPVNFIRIGAAFYTPTVYRLTDEYEVEMDSHFDLPDENGDKDYPVGNDYWLPDMLTSTYRVTTPLKAIGSVAVILGTFGILSVDYEYVDYKTMRMRADDVDYFDTNKFIQEHFTATHNFRIGGEAIVAEGFSLRAGYNFNASPFETPGDRVDRSRTAVSGGFGIKGDNLYFDASFTRSVYGETSYFYNLPNDVNAPVPGADFTTAQNMVNFTFGIKF